MKLVDTNWNLHFKINKPVKLNCRKNSYSMLKMIDVTEKKIPDFAAFGFQTALTSKINELKFKQIFLKII